MKYIVLSGISPYALKELENNKVKTIEVRSPNNFFSVLMVNVGDTIFLTSASLFDLRQGTAGVTAAVIGKEISTHRLVHKMEELYEEAEVQIARLQLQVKGHARVRRAECCAFDKATVVDAEEVRYFEGR
ncbi:MAG: DUF473 domain-containing protein [Candidatus Methanoperedens sp.]|jgi:hypothetical protein|nr:DUF473 domain-containing protein [Candidatus Methanoperedens sp.]PKL53040.1 MAG: DUF473 domain-containing protein [Candidatus Methanoperedenaceae archaeon HGW-Methanoperedenaceae-1]